MTRVEPCMTTTRGDFDACCRACDDAAAATVWRATFSRTRPSQPQPSLRLIIARVRVLALVCGHYC